MHTLASEFNPTHLLVDISLCFLKNDREKKVLSLRRGRVTTLPRLTPVIHIMFGHVLPTSFLTLGSSSGSYRRP